MKKKASKNQKVTTQTMTLDKLGMMVANGFAHSNGRIDTVDHKLTALEHKLSKFQEETNDNFSKIRQDILRIHDTFATKDQLRKVISRIELLEKNAVMKK